MKKIALETNQAKNNNIVYHRTSVSRERREKQNGHRSLVLWFTGLSGAEKSTLAHAVEERLHQMGCRTFVFDEIMSATDLIKISVSQERTVRKTYEELVRCVDCF